MERVKTQKNQGYHIHTKSYEYVLIDCFAEEKDFHPLLELLSNLASNKEVYVSASDVKGIDQRYVLQQVIDPKSRLTYKLALSEVDQRSLTQDIFQNRVVCFDIYSHGAKMDWDKYCGMESINRKRAINNGSMYANICLTEETRIEIFCKTRDFVIKQFISQLDERGYKILKSYKIFDIFRKKVKD